MQNIGCRFESKEILRKKRKEKKKDRDRKAKPEAIVKKDDWKERFTKREKSSR